MSEKQQDLGQLSEEETIVQNGRTLEAFAGSLALLFVQESLDAGKMIHIPSLGLVITPEKELKKVSDLTEAELRANPHIQ